MNMREAVELILTGKRVAARSGSQFTVSRDRLGSIGGFSASEIAQIEQAVAAIEMATDAILMTLR